MTITKSEFECKVDVSCKQNLQECKISQLECLLKCIVFWIEKQKHYARQTMIKCNHPKGGPFILESRFATTLGSYIEKGYAIVCKVGKLLTSNVCYNKTLLIFIHHVFQSRGPSKEF